MHTVITDWHSPFIVRAVENIDGDFLDEEYETAFTGGGHSIESIPTASNEYFRVYSEGKLLNNGDKGISNRLVFTWSNLVQGNNTVKKDGTGRSILRELHRMVFDGLSWVSEVEIVPIEDVEMVTWYGFQCASTNNGSWTRIKYIGADNRRTYSGTEKSECVGNHVNSLEGSGDKHMVQMELDTSYDLGCGSYNNDKPRLFNESYGKAYFWLISNKTLTTGCTYAARCTYRFFPTYNF